jgi:hypothetical protein
MQSRLLDEEAKRERKEQVLNIRLIR